MSRLRKTRCRVCSKMFIGRHTTRWHRAVAKSNKARKTGKKALLSTRRKMSRTQKVVQNRPELLVNHSVKSKRMWARRTKAERRALGKKIAKTLQGRPFSPQHLANLRAAHKARRGKHTSWNLGRVPGSYGKRFWYHGKSKISMRSRWEVAFAEKLDQWGFTWQYELQGFRVGKGNWNGQYYWPDFYLPEFDLYVEIKGFLRAENRRKLKKFRQKFPDVRWMMLQQRDMNMLGILDRPVHRVKAVAVF